MATITFNDGYKVSDYGKPYFIAELNSSHNGNVEQAKKMIDAAKSVGCNCVKFQSWTPDTLYSKSYYDKNPIAKRMVTKFSMSESELEELAAYCAEKEIGFSSTPYSRNEVDFLAKQNPPFIKVASMDINNYGYLQYIAEKGLPIVLSTGMADTAEINKAVNAIKSTGNDRLCLLHCVSIYPASSDMINLNNILGLREQFPEYPIGYSDHTLGVEIPSAAIAFGACLIEKHFTLDNSKMGWDNSMAMQPEDFATLITCCNNVHTALGSKQRIVSEQEMKQRTLMRRSVVTVRDIAQGETIRPEDLDVKRPGTGYEPEMINQIVNHTALKDMEKDTLVLPGDF